MSSPAVPSITKNTKPLGSSNNETPKGRDHAALLQVPYFLAQLPHLLAVLHHIADSRARVSKDFEPHTILTDHGTYKDLGCLNTSYLLFGQITWSSQSCWMWSVYARPPVGTTLALDFTHPVPLRQEGWLRNKIKGRMAWLVHLLGHPSRILGCSLSDCFLNKPIWDFLVNTHFCTNT